MRTHVTVGSGRTPRSVGVPVTNRESHQVAVFLEVDLLFYTLCLHPLFQTQLSMHD
jgi:hypothetical protein